MDLVPEAIVGPIGYVDDIALAAYVLNSIVNNASPEVVQRHWVTWASDSEPSRNRGIVSLDVSWVS